VPVLIGRTPTSYDGAWKTRGEFMVSTPLCAAQYLYGDPENKCDPLLGFESLFQLIGSEAG
jgi:hypothetical protein